MENIGLYLYEFDGTKQDFLGNNNNNEFFPHYIQLRDKLRDKFNANLQIFNPDILFSADQARMIIYYIFKAFQSNSNISDDKNMEFLLYLVNSRQINVSIKMGGVKPPENRDSLLKMGIILFGPLSGLKKGDKYLHKKLSPNDLVKFTYPPLTKWEVFLSQREINPANLIHIINSYDVERETRGEKEFREFFKNKTKESWRNISLQQILKFFSTEMVKKSINDLLIQNMARLYLNNYRKG